MLVDEFDREVSGVRISLTDRCNFDCVYCHNEGLGDTRGPMAPRDHEMSADAVVRFLEVAREFDVDAVKFTGGEPMLREDLAEIVRRVPDGMAASMTTNGTFLPGRAEALVDSGLERVNVSLDALEPEDFAEVTQRGAFEAVLDGIDAALEAGLDPVKLNMVLMEETAGHVPAMVDHVAAREGLQLQLLQYMPELTGNREWGVDVDSLHDWLTERTDRTTRREMHGRRRYWLDGDGDGAGSRDGEDAPTPGSERSDGTRVSGEQGSTGGMVEVVDPVGNESFCANCHRVRVTHDGKLKGCLNRTDDLRSMGEMSKDEIRATFRETVAKRVPYYGEYMVQEDGEWVRNEEYLETVPEPLD